MYDQDTHSFDILQMDSCGFEPRDAETRYSDVPTNERFTTGCKKVPRKIIKYDSTTREEIFTNAEAMLKRYIVKPIDSLTKSYVLTAFFALFASNGLLLNFSAIKHC